MKWSVNEGCEAQELRQRGWCMEYIADYLNDRYHAGCPVRSHWGVKNHLILLKRDEGELADNRRRAEARRSCNFGTTHGEVPTREGVARLMEERDRRYGAPHRSLSHEFFGDPPIGYAALDRHA